MTAPAVIEHRRPVQIGLLLLLAGLQGGVAVALGAYAAHGMAGAYAARAVGWVETASQYQLAHAVAIVAVALLAACAPAGLARGAALAAGWGFALGALLFAGALYGLAFTGMGMFGAVAPFGGLAMILGWAALAIGGVLWAMRRAG